MKISLIHPPQLNVIDNRQDPPLGLMYLASVLEKAGFEASIVDLAGLPEKDWDSRIERTDIYGITCYTATLSNSKKISDLVKMRYPGSTVIVGGAHPSALPDRTIEYENFDFLVKGEGEGVIVDLVDGIAAGRTGGIVNGGPVLYLDELPFPARHLVDIYSYSRTVLDRKATNIITGRGCPYKCSFCYKGLYGHKFRLRSARNVIEEAETIVDTYGIRAFHFLDDIFTINKSRLDRILESFRKMDVHFRCNSRGGPFTTDDFEDLYNGGCREIAFGIESGSQEILDRINKQNTVERNRKAILNAKRVGIVTKAYFIIGLPGETRETVDETRRFIEETRPDKLSIYTFVPYPGTPIWQDPANYGVEIVDDDYDNYYIIDKQGYGGITFDLKSVSTETLTELRNDLVRYTRELYEGHQT